MLFVYLLSKLFSQKTLRWQYTHLTKPGQGKYITTGRNPEINLNLSMQHKPWAITQGFAMPHIAKNPGLDLTLGPPQKIESAKRHTLSGFNQPVIGQHFDFAAAFQRLLWESSNSGQSESLQASYHSAGDRPCCVQSSGFHRARQWLPGHRIHSASLPRSLLRFLTLCSLDENRYSP